MGFRFGKVLLAEGVGGGGVGGGGQRGPISIPYLDVQIFGL